MMDIMWFSIGMACGLGSGIGVGTAGGSNGSKEKIRVNLSAMMECGELMIQDREGNALSADEFIHQILPAG